MSASASYVRLLGHPGAERAGQSLHGLERNPKKLAVLAYLAAQPAQKFVSRDALLAVFWSESAEKPARHALSQSLHFIRQQLGSDALLISGPSLLKLNPALVDVDVRAFEGALDSGDVERACALYSGELLEGISLESDAADWLDRERQRLRLRAAQAFWAYATENVRAGKSAAATHNAQRAIQCDPTAEPECSQFLSVAVEEKQYTVARAIASFFTTALDRATGGDTPTDAFVARAREIQESCAELPPAAAQPTESAPRETPHLLVLRTPRRRALVNGLLAVAALALFAFAIRTVMVRPVLAGRGAAAVQQIVITETQPLANDLEPLRASVVNVIADEFARIGWQVFTPRTKASREQTAGYALQLSPLRTDSGIVFTYRMTDAVSEAVLVSDVGAFGAKPDVHEIARTISDRIRAEVGRKQSMLGSLSPPENDAWQRVSLRTALADSLFDSGSMAEAARAFKVADSLFAATKWSKSMHLAASVRRLRQLEYFGATRFLLGDVAGRDSVFELAEHLATDLVQRYQDRPEPLEARASIRFMKMIFSGPRTLKTLETVEADLDAVIRRHEGSSTAYARLSAVLEMRGDLESAGVMANEAARRDVFLANDKDILFRLFRVAFELEDDGTAERHCSAIEHRYPDATPGAVCRLLLMGWSKNTKPDTAEAFRIVREGATDESADQRKQTIPRLEALQAGVLARAGLTDRARAVLKKLERVDDADLVPFRAAALRLLGDMQEARTLALKHAQRNELNDIALRYGRIYEGLLEDQANTER